MDIGDITDSLPESLAFDDGGDVRRLAALENEALQVEHADSLQLEERIAAAMESASVDSKNDVLEVAEFGHQKSPHSSVECVSLTSSSPHRVEPIETIEGYSAEKTFGFSRTQLDSVGIKHFWETGFWSDFLDPNKDFFSSFEGHFKRPVDPTSSSVFDASVDVTHVERPAKSVKKFATFMDHVRETTVMSWKDQRDAEWQVAIFRWHSMLCRWSSGVRIVEQMLENDGFTAQAQLLVDVFHHKAPATIMKRCRSMSRMTNFFIDHGRQFPCDESQCYEFLCVERANGAPPSRIKGYLEALMFCRHVLGVTEFEYMVLSRRCQGVAALDVHHKVKQAEPLTVKQLETLHQVLAEDPEIWNRVFAGMLLFCVYARSRWSDSQHGEKFLEDVGESGACAYIEVSTGVHKTARALQLRHMYLPLVAPCEGVVSGNWGELWCQSRKELGIHDLNNFPLMPAPDSAQEPTERPLSSTEAGSWMRALLKVDCTNKTVRYSSHSLKATCLSYAAKRGLAFEDRLSLGYHTQSLKMALVYSRDGASRPLRVLESLLKEIRNRQFNPNDTRSGRLSKLPAFEVGADVSQASNSIGSFEAVSPVEACEPSDVKLEANPSCGVDTVSDHATTGSDTDSDEETVVRPKMSFRDIEAPAGTYLHQHVKFKTLHLMKTDNRVVFLCGRKTGNMYRVADTRHPFDTPKCRQCFRAKLD